MTNHELSRSGEMSNQEVFDIFDRASSHQRNTYLQYHIGDGLAVRIGWVDIDHAGTTTPRLLVAIDDARQARSTSLSVGVGISKYTRHTRPTLPGLEWLAASREERYAARIAARHQRFTVQTTTLSRVAQAVANHDPYAGEYLTDEMLQDQLSTNPLPGTDTENIRSLVDTFAAPLD